MLFRIKLGISFWDPSVLIPKVFLTDEDTGTVRRRYVHLRIILQDARGQYVHVRKVHSRPWTVISGFLEPEDLRAQCVDAGLTQDGFLVFMPEEVFTTRVLANLAVREIREELGLDVTTSMKDLTVQTFEEDDRTADTTTLHILARIKLNVCLDRRVLRHAMGKVRVRELCDVTLHNTLCHRVDDLLRGM